LTLLIGTYKNTLIYSKLKKKTAFHHLDQVCPGKNDRLPTSHLWKELRRLEGLAAGLETGEIAWEEDEEEGEDDDGLEEDLLKLLELVRNMGPRGKRTDPSSKYNLFQITTYHKEIFIFNLHA